MICLHPQLPIQTPILNRFRNILWLNYIMVSQIGYGSRDLGGVNAM